MDSNVVPDREQLLDEIMGYVMDAAKEKDPPSLEQIEQQFPHVAGDASLVAEINSMLLMHVWFDAASKQDLVTDRRDTSGDAATKLPVVQPIWGGYLLLDELGQGGMGRVYKAWHIRGQRFVALKQLQSHLLEDDVARQRFCDEPRHMRELLREGIVRVLDVGEVEGTPYFTMELVEGTNLASLARNRALPDRKIAQLMREIADTVAFAHRSGILHRDLKPANVLLTTDCARRSPILGWPRTWRTNPI